VIKILINHIHWRRKKVSDWLEFMEVFQLIKFLYP